MLISEQYNAETALVRHLGFGACLLSHRTTDAKESIEEEAGAHLDHEQKLSRFNGSTLILHTRYDGLVDVSNAHRLHEWSSEPKKLKIFEQGNHNTILFTNFHEYFNLVHAFIQGLVR